MMPCRAWRFLSVTRRLNLARRARMSFEGMPVTRILIADDHEVVRFGLRAILEAHEGWEVVAEACDGKEAIAKAVETSPDVAIIDYSLPMMNGVEATRQIRARVPTAEVLIFTMHDSEVLVGELLQAGARAYLLKSDAKQYLIAVESLASHKPFFTGKVSAQLLDTFLAKGHGKLDATLSPRERVIVQLIAEGHSNKEMTEILNLSVKTIETHRAAAMRKLDVTSTAAIVRYAIRHKLVEPYKHLVRHAWFASLAVIQFRAVAKAVMKYASQWFELRVGARDIIHNELRHCGPIVVVARAALKRPATRAASGRAGLSSRRGSRVLYRHAVGSDFRAVLAPERRSVLRADDRPAAGMVALHRRCVPGPCGGGAWRRDARAAVAG